MLCVGRGLCALETPCMHGTSIGSQGLCVGLKENLQSQMQLSFLVISENINISGKWVYLCQLNCHLSVPSTGKDSLLRITLEPNVVKLLLPYTFACTLNFQDSQYLFNKFESPCQNKKVCDIQMFAALIKYQ